MDKEFHFTVTYLACRAVGASFERANRIAQSAQFVDDNTKDMRRFGCPAVVTQTANILRPKKELLEIYPLFHFIPGYALAKSARRVDGLMSEWNVTPGSKNAALILRAALKTANDWRIGIALHAYCDTWAHQNFTGRLEHFNGMEGLVEGMIPNIGHADARHMPDLVGLEWEDARLVNPVVQNKVRFRACVLGMCAELIDQFGDMGTCKEAEPVGKILWLLELERAGSRAYRARQMAKEPCFGGDKLPVYIAKTWASRWECEEWRAFQRAADAHKVAAKKILKWT